MIKWLKSKFSKPAPKAVALPVPQPPGPKKYFEYMVDEHNGYFEWVTRAYIPHPMEIRGVASTHEKARLEAQKAGKGMLP